MEMLNVLKSKYCWLVIFLASTAGYYVVKPILDINKAIDTLFLASIFLITFSFSIACMVRKIKLNIQALKSHETWVNVIAYVIGFTSLQTCLVTGVCIQGIGLPLLLTILPASMVTIFEQYAKAILALSILAMVYSFHSMGCFKTQPRRKIKPKVKLNLKS